MIDWHCHILPGLDDGPETMAEALEMARVLSDAGFQTVLCTPHCVQGGYDNTPDKVRKATNSLQAELQRAGIPLAVQPGMEYYLDEYFPAQLETLQPLGNTRLVLVEPPCQPPAELIKENVFQVRRRGFIPLIAHPERCSLLAEPLERKRDGFLKQRSKQFLDKLLKTRPAAVPLAGDSLRVVLKDMGCLFQGNISSLAGWYGHEVRAQAIHNLDTNFYSYFGSDAHSVHSLEKGLLTGMEVLAGHQMFAILRNNPSDQTQAPGSDHMSGVATKTVPSASWDDLQGRIKPT